MPLKVEIRLKGALITCVGFLAGSLGVFVVRYLHISSFYFALKFDRIVEHTKCYRLAAILPILSTEAYPYRRGKGSPYTEASTPVPEDPTPSHPPAVIRPTLVPLVEYSL